MTSYNISMHTYTLVSLLGLLITSTVAFTSNKLLANGAKRHSPIKDLTILANDVSSSTDTLGKPICIYKQITIQPSGMNECEQPRQAVSVEDLTPSIKSFLASSNMHNGVIHVISRHTTTAITINERESRLAADVEKFFLGICPPDERSSSDNKVTGVRYLHNDIDKRPDGEEEAQRCRENGWDIDNAEILEKWRDQEPINAHAHLISMMLGSSEAIPVVDGEMVIGQWQSILMVDLDGPRTRTVGVQLMGYE
ncbi:hypothetical protein ACHAWO_001620 [Cyclotella atomus]|jgi:thiamine phosphate synthase YjbQ (UPF0047 family)|uniref:Secondary thiamine-phosphate synthase enzyme n=1 Tax=Cyclotella atomus TaxID=382360 RepID=A0ABD3P0F8_9STRA